MNISRRNAIQCHAATGAALCLPGAFGQAIPLVEDPTKIAAPVAEGPTPGPATHRSSSPQLSGAKVTAVSLQGFDGRLAWTQDPQGLSVTLPDKPPSQYAVTLKIQGVLTK